MARIRKKEVVKAAAAGNQDAAEVGSFGHCGSGEA